MGARRKQRPFFPVSPLAKEPPYQVHNLQVMSHQRVIGRPVERADFGQCSGQSPFARTDAFAKGDMGGDDGDEDGGAMGAAKSLFGAIFGDD